MKRTLALAAIVGAIEVLTLWPRHSAVLNWDEVDYTEAARLGVVANMFERGSLGPVDFYRFVQAKRHGQPPPLPQSYDETRDPLVRRHHHPPLVAYLMAPLAWSRSERVVRLVQLAGALALTVALLWVHAAVSRRRSLAGMVCVGILAVWSAQILFATISFHGWTAVFTTLTCAATARFIADGSRARLWQLCAATAATAVTLQTGAIVAVGVIVSLLVWRPPLASAWRAIGLGVLVVVGIVFVVWPGVLLKISVVKIAALYAYLIAHGQEYAGVTGAGGGRAVAGIVLPALLSGALASVYLLVRRRGEARSWGPFLVIGGLYTLAMMRVAIYPTYPMPGLVPLMCLVGLAVDELAAPIMQAVVAVGLALLVGFSGAFQLRPAADDGFRGDVAWLAEIAGSRPVVADGGHIFSYYLGRPVAALSLSYDERSFLVRRRGVYEPIDRRALAGDIVIVQRNRSRFFAARDGGQAMLVDCARVERATFVAYDCGASPSPSNR